MNMIQLRDYQQEDLERTRQAIARGNKRVILKEPTGAGKTVMAGAMTMGARRKGKTVMFVCDRKSLIDQTSAAFDKMGIDHGVIQADHWRTNWSKPVQIASIQTLSRRRGYWADVVIVDEAHTMYKRQLEMLANWDSVFVGLTATPYTKGLGLHWDELIEGTSTRELIEKGYLSDFVVYAPPIVDLNGIPIRGGDYEQRALADRVDRTQPVGDILTTWKKHGNNEKTMCFAINVEHSKHIVQEFNDNGISAVHIDAYMDEADVRLAIKRHRAGEIKMISCVDMLAKGYDDTGVVTLIMARPTKSLTVHIQQIGRPLRVEEGKGDAIILDHGGNVARHGFPTDESFPVELDRTEKGKKQEEPERKEPLPKPCPACHFMKQPKQHICPACGFAPERVNKIEHEAGELVKLELVKNQRERQEFYSGLLGYAEAKGYSDGWAAHAYKAKHGAFPNDLAKTRTEPTKVVNNWVTHLRIKKARST